MRRIRTIAGGGRRRSTCAILRYLGVAMVPAIAAPALGQLRPYEPAAWDLFDGPQRLELSLGAGSFEGQRASLAGESGQLTELGRAAFALRTGNVVIEASGTIHWLFTTGETFAPAAGGAQSDSDGKRADSGDYRIATTIRLTPPDRPGLAILRFGTRLPTTDNRVGLERDETDFFALIGGRLDRGPVRLTAETGVGIHGTRDSGFEQSDVLVYLMGAGLPRAPLAPTLLLLGHADGLANRTIRGNEELAEARLRLRTQGRVWFGAQGVVGLTEFSPDWGVIVSIGARH